LCAFTVLSPYQQIRNFANYVTRAATLVMLAAAGSSSSSITPGEIDLSAAWTSSVAMSLFVVLSNPGGIRDEFTGPRCLSLATVSRDRPLFYWVLVARVGIPRSS
jgi:ribose/xylose/arabinose/galactoside ABC-type transport system permease subunit